MTSKFLNSAQRKLVDDRIAGIDFGSLDADGIVDQVSLAIGFALERVGLLGAWATFLHPAVIKAIWGTSNKSPLQVFPEEKLSPLIDVFMGLLPPERMTVICFVFELAAGMDDEEAGTAIYVAEALLKEFQKDEITAPAKSLCSLILCGCSVILGGNNDLEGDDEVPNASAMLDCACVLADLVSAKPK